MIGVDPTFPPLLSGIVTADGDDPVEIAHAKVRAGEAGAGDLFWSPSERQLSTALVLEPDVAARQALEVAYITMVAFGDCLGAMAPPEVGVMYRWPSMILVNGAEAGSVSVHLPDDCGDDRTPDWMVIGLCLDIIPPDGGPEPGHCVDRTTLWDEGCGFLTRTQLLESFARHFKTWLHRWEVDGSRPVREAWLARFSKPGETVSFLAGGKVTDGEFLGLDDMGNLLARSGEQTVIASLRDNLKSGGNRYRQETPL